MEPDGYWHIERNINLGDRGAPDAFGTHPLWIAYLNEDYGLALDFQHSFYARVGRRPPKSVRSHENLYKDKPLTFFHERLRNQAEELAFGMSRQWPFNSQKFALIFPKFDAATLMKENLFHHQGSYLALAALHEFLEMGYDAIPIKYWDWGIESPLDVVMTHCQNILSIDDSIVHGQQVDVLLRNVLSLATQKSIDCLNLVVGANFLNQNSWGALRYDPYTVWYSKPRPRDSDLTTENWNGWLKKYADSWGFEPQQLRG